MEGNIVQIRVQTNGTKCILTQRSCSAQSKARQRDISAWLICTLTSFTTFSWDISRSNCIKIVVLNDNSVYQKQKKKGESGIDREREWDHDFANGGGGNAVTVLGLLELLDSNRFATVSFDLSQKNQPVSPFPNFPYQIILLQPLWPIAIGISSDISHGDFELCGQQRGLRIQSRDAKLDDEILWHLDLHNWRISIQMEKFYQLYEGELGTKITHKNIKVTKTSY